MLQKGVEIRYFLNRVFNTLSPLRKSAGGSTLAGPGAGGKDDIKVVTVQSLDIHQLGQNPNSSESTDIALLEPKILGQDSLAV